MSGGLLVIGGVGLVGNSLLRAWKARGPEGAAATCHGRAVPGFHPLDIRDEGAVRELIGRLRPSVVAMAAANPYVDYCETHPGETRAVNVDGTLNAARASRALGARLVFYSSDYVFDGVKGAYTEEDAPNPVNEYGRQKAETERGVLEADPRNLVLRTSGAYGWQRDPKNFVLQVRDRLSRGQVLRVAGDLRYNPTYAENLAEITAALIGAGASGIYHAVGADSLARYDFAVRAARAFGLDESLLDRVPSAALASATPRPKETILLTDKLRAAVSVAPVGVDEGLRRMKETEPAWREYARSLPEPSSRSAPA